ALLIVAVFELFLHTRDPMRLIAYASDEGQYHAVRDTIDAQGPAEVALVGSSQMREGVIMETLQAELQKRLGRAVHVANYATRGARLDAMAAVVQYLQKQPKPPQLIVVGLSPRDLRADTIDWPRVALFWDFSDWRAAYGQAGWPVTDVLPVVIRNAAGRVLHTLRYREEISLTLQRLFTPLGVVAREGGNPILGQLTDQHEGGRGLRSLASSQRPIRRLLDRAKDSYLVKEPPAPRPAMAGSLRDLTHALAADPTRGLLVQMPVAEHLQAFLDQAGQTAAFQAAVSAEAGANGLMYIPVDQQGFRPTNDHFSDLQHHNRPGAEAYAGWLANVIADRLSNP
ncbi:MAG TPA: hypothetical protein VF595_01510, partial [Tepidisphaeraceae bacterium]